MEILAQMNREHMQSLMALLAQQATLAREAALSDEVDDATALDAVKRFLALCVEASNCFNQKV